MMALTAAQKTAVKNDINASSDLNIYPNNCDGNFAIAAIYNIQASPAFTVWKTSVPLGEVGKSFNASELAGLSALNSDRLRTIAMYLADGVDPSLQSVRDFFNDVFSGAGGTNTRTALLALWKRLATRIEKLLATGTGSDASPATMGFVGQITPTDIEQARMS